VGAIAWVIVAFVRTSVLPETDLINKVLLLGILVIIPLGLSLVAMPDEDGRHSLWYRLAIYAQPVGAIAAVISLFLEQSVIAAVFASCWFVVTALIACFALWRLVRRGPGPVEEFSLDAGLGFLSIGGGWFILSRLGIQPLGFGDTIVLLTAVHFHFAGFAAPILAGLAGRMIGSTQPARKLSQVAVFAIILGVPLVAAGITASPILALVGAVTVSFGLFVLAFAVIGWILPAVDSLPARILLAISSVSSCSAMVLASVYAYSILSKRLIVDIPQMAMTHGIINAFGFALCGLVAWSFVKPMARATSSK
jgi:hypothetical protein